MSKPLEEEIPELEELQGVRDRARALRDEGLSILNTRPYYLRKRRPTLGEEPAADSEAGNWVGPGDEVEKALILRALELRCDKDQGKKTRQSLQDDLHEINLADCNESRDPGLRESSYDHVPIFRCAHILQALVSIPGWAFEHATLCCFHRVVEELYSAEPPIHTQGAARAGGGAGQTAFATGECVHALLSLKRTLEQSANALEELDKARDEERAGEGTPQLWRKMHTQRIRYSLHVTLSDLQSHLIVNLDLEQRKANLKDVENAVQSFTGDIDDVLQKFGDAFKRASSALDNFFSNARRVRTEGTSVADRAIDQLGETFKKLASPNLKAKACELKEDTVKPLRAMATFVHRLLDPTEQFLASVIDRELAAASLYPQHTCDGAELAFAAASFGRLTCEDPDQPWDHPRVIAAAKLLSKLLSDDGHVPTVLPFDVWDKGYRLHVSGLEAALRIAQLMRHADVELDATVVPKLMRLFRETRGVSPDENPPGWASDPPDPHRMSQWWATALAVRSLDHLMRMLDEQINRRVLAHFSVWRAREPDLDLGQLFYTDYGLASRNKNKDESIAVKLERMRAHILGVKLDKEGLYSMVLYGPPGTGKTTLLEALAKSTNVPLVEITPSDILVGGEEAVERRTRVVFSALAMLTGVVILMDEFDPILHLRDVAKWPPTTVFQFLTPGMLPKLKKLNGAAKEHRVAYALTTNLIGSIDPAAIRGGRFDDKHGIYPPDIVSRVGRLASQFKSYGDKLEDAPTNVRERVLTALQKTAGGPMTTLGKPGWFTVPKKEEQKAERLFGYVLGSDEVRWPEPETGEFPKEKPKGKEDSLAVRDWESWWQVCEWDGQLNKLKTMSDWEELVKVVQED